MDSSYKLLLSQTDMISTTETSKGKKCLLFNEYRYYCDRIRNTTTYWRCGHGGGCIGRAVQKGDELPVVTSMHNHDPDKQRNDIEKFKTDIKHQIREVQTPIKQIYRSELLQRYSNSPEDVPALPQYHQIKNSLYRTKNENYPTLPKSIDEIALEGNAVDY